MLKSAIPFIDLRGKPVTDLLRAFPDKASALVTASRRSFGFASQIASPLVMPFADKKSHAWLKKSKNPYLHEIEMASDVLGQWGVYALNLADSWACTSGAYLIGGQVQLLRVLDWPFPGLGKHMVVVHQQGPGGDYYNITWPAVSGVYQAMAPGRFAASINLAPMRKHGLGFAGDWLTNRLHVGRQTSLPPSHLLRKVFDEAKNYDEAKEMLCDTPIATPMIFTLTGLKSGEGCVIERLEQVAEIKEMAAAQIVSASNEFHSAFESVGKGWRPRMQDSAGRYKQSQEISTYDLQQDYFDWLKSPILNPLTRLVMRAEARTGFLALQGYEGLSPVTNIFVIAPSSH